MKNILLLFSFMLIAGMGYSQIKVESNGWTSIFGDGTPAQGLLQVGQDNYAESVMVFKSGITQGGILKRATLRYLSFAPIQKNYIQSGTDNVSGSTADLIFGSIGGQVNHMIIKAGGQVGIGVANPSHLLQLGTDDAWKPNGGMWSGASDKRLKKNIEKYKGGLNEILQIEPVVYNYNGKGAIIDTEKQHVGIIAQEIQKIAPYMVTEVQRPVLEKKFDAEYNLHYTETSKYETYLGVDPTPIVYMLVNSVKELNDEIVSRDSQIDELETSMADLLKEIELIKSQLPKTSTTLINLEGDSENQVYLGQNSPNPFNGQTTIEYNVPKDAQNAQLHIMDNNGRLIKTVVLDNYGKGEAIINTNNMASGAYNYTLTVDGKNIASKKMILTK